MGLLPGWTTYILRSEFSTCAWTGFESVRTVRIERPVEQRSLRSARFPRKLEFDSGGLLQFRLR